MLLLLLPACDAGTLEPATDTPGEILLSATALDMVDGDTLRLHASIIGLSGMPIASSSAGQVRGGVRLTWASSNPDVVSIDGTGLVRARQSGTAVLTATAGPVSSKANAKVGGPKRQRVSKVTVSPHEYTFSVVGSTVQLSATVLDDHGNIISDPSITWSSGNPEIATVDGSGTVTSRALGLALVTAVSGGVSDTATLHVRSEISSISVSPASASVEVGGDAALVATAVDATGLVVEGVGFTWATSDPAVATVTSSGVVRGMAAGTVSIQASAQGRSGTAVLTVTPSASPPPGGGDPYANVGAFTPFDRTTALDLASYCRGDGVTDCTSAIQRWIDDGRAQGRHLYVSPGTYLYGSTRRLYDRTQIRCADPATTVFKNTNEQQAYFIASENFGSGSPPYTDMRVENCGFDMNAAQANFASTIVIRGGSDPARWARNITIRGNRVFDSTQPGQMYVERDRQRQYILVLAAQDVLIEGNRLSEGGRIKAGRPGSRIVVRNNTLHNINDNAITVVNFGDYTGSHYLIENNHITNALGSGIFFGSDGQGAGTPAQVVEDIVIRNNTIVGGQQACIHGTLPNHARRIFIQGNSCEKVQTVYTYSDSFDRGVGIIRADHGVLPIEDLTITGNIFRAFSPFGLSATFVRHMHRTTCVLMNQYHVGTSTAMRLSLGDGSLARVSGNELNGGRIRIDEGDYTVDQSGSTAGCWQP
jgi:hypothetical protein